MGADLSGLAKGFSKAGNSTGSFKQKAAKDISSLKDSLSKMKGAYSSIKEATSDIDLTKSVSKQITEANKELGTLQKTAADLENKLSFWSEIEPAGMQYQTQALRESLAAVDAQADSLYYKLQQLENVKSIGESIGVDDISYSSLNKLQMNIAAVEDELHRTEHAADGTSSATKRLGNSAKTAGGKVKTTSSWIAGLRKQSKASSLSVSDLARSLKRVGVVAVGIKLAGAVLGEFRSIVTSYISQNETLQAKVDELKAGFGQALAPAINVATNALSKLMPYVLGISNAIGSFITNLFGSGWTSIADGASAAAAATNSATAAQKAYNRTLAGFDKITKLGSSNSDNSSKPTAEAVEIALPSWLTELPKAVNEAFRAGDCKGIGVAIAEAINGGLKQDSDSETSLGTSIAELINKGIQIASGLTETLDWDQLKESVCQSIVDMFTEIDWENVGKLVWNVVLGLFTRKNPLLDNPKLTVEMKAEFTAWKDSMKDKVASFKAKLTSWKDSMKDKVVSFKAKLTTWMDSLKDKYISFKAKLTAWKDYITNKDISFTAKMTTFKDHLKDKYLSFKAKISKGWSGSLAKALGIDSITSKLNLKLPKIVIDWKSGTGIWSNFTYPSFSLKWNAKGAILNGAQIFGRVGNTFLGGGEAGGEALLPLDRNTGWMDKIADRVAKRVSTGGSGEQNLVIYLTLDGKVVTKTVIRNINAQTKATGKNPLAAYV